MIVEDFGDVFLKTLNCLRKIYYFGFFEIGYKSS